MKIITPYAKMLPVVGTWMETVDAGDGIQCGKESENFTLDMGVSLLKHVEWCARISHRSEDVVTMDSWKRIIQSVVLDHGDWSVTEHASVTVDAYVDRGITHEWVRHRLFSYTQESTRFVNYKNKMPPSFVRPGGIDSDERMKWWDVAVATCEASYQKLLEAGCAPLNGAFGIYHLPSGLVVTGNLRSWRHLASSCVLAKNLIHR